MNYDPYSGRQIRFERTDPTGRWVPIHEVPEPAWMAWLGGCAAGCVLALILFLGV